eukprot:jgi/Ulvmu1/7751/UM039_0059.1
MQAYAKHEPHKLWVEYAAAAGEGTRHTGGVLRAWCASRGTRASWSARRRLLPPCCAQTLTSYKFPAFVIIECGQSLDAWARDNTNNGFITIFQAQRPDLRFPSSTCRQRSWPPSRVAAARSWAIGRTQLPWEALSDGAKERLGKLRGLKRTVLRCLDRAALPGA